MPLPVMVSRLRAVSGIFLFIALWAVSGCTGDRDTRSDSMVSILSDPAHFEGRVVTLRGYVHLSRNHDAIFLSSEDYRWDIQANGIWLHMPRCANRAGQPVTSGYMTVVGNFTAKLHGYAAGWVGEIDNIKLCRLIEGIDGEPRPRPVTP